MMIPLWTLKHIQYSLFAAPNSNKKSRNQTNKKVDKKNHFKSDDCNILLTSFCVTPARMLRRNNFRVIIPVCACKKNVLNFVKKNCKM